MAAILKLENIGKKFGGNYVLQNINLEFEKGEIHSIIGENGAGKSTLMKIIGGIYHPNEGKIYKDGEMVTMKNPLDASAHKIGIVHQELSVSANMSVAENIFIGRQPVNKLGFINFKELNSKTENLLKEIGVDLNPNEKVQNLSVAMQQIIEVVKIISRNIDLLILDEPTSSLSKNEIDRLFELILKLRDEKNTTVIFISHKIDEVMAISDRITVLRNGRQIGTLTHDESTPEEMINMMVGRDLSNEKYYPATTEPAEVILKAEGLCRSGKFQNIGFELRPNQILGVFGLIGSGRTEAILSMIGADNLDTGTIWYEGKNVKFKSPKDAINSGIYYLTENRRDMGLFMSKPMTDNIVSAKLQEVTTKCSTINNKKIDKICDEYIKQLNIQPSDKTKKVLKFSGGNQQKILFAKALMTKPKVLIVDEPTRGVDVGVKVTIHKMLRELADSGMAVMMISSELPEILKLSDKVMIMHDGEYKGILENKGLSEVDIMSVAYTKGEATC